MGVAWWVRMMCGVSRRIVQALLFRLCRPLTLHTTPTRRCSIIRPISLLKPAGSLREAWASRIADQVNISPRRFQRIDAAASIRMRCWPDPERPAYRSRLMRLTAVMNGWSSEYRTPPFDLQIVFSTRESAAKDVHLIHQHRTGCHVGLTRINTQTYAGLAQGWDGTSQIIGADRRCGMLTYDPRCFIRPVS